MNKTTFHISKMDCPSEERMIRIKLQPQKSIKSMNFDLQGRRLEVYHDGNAETILDALAGLDLGTTLLGTEPADCPVEEPHEKAERNILWAVLIINFSFFLLELLAGILAKSMGLVADGLDMLADAYVYGLALLAVGGALAFKKRVARIAGFFQLVLALIGFAEVIRRFAGMAMMPDFRTMILVSALALLANIACLYLLQKSRSRDIHMRASMIFTSNDVIINAGVILAGFLVHWLGSGYPDLVIGSVVFVIVACGAFRILKLAV
ncbi:MAG: cation transporter [Bacteroidales bacterium]|nr:cation transporter [Bacteroidales bacterium]